MIRNDPVDVLDEEHVAHLGGLELYLAKHYFHVDCLSGHPSPSLLCENIAILNKLLPFVNSIRQLQLQQCLILQVHIAVLLRAEISGNVLQRVEPLRLLPQALLRPLVHLHQLEIA